MNENILFEFYEVIGESVWHLQNVEEALNTLILMKHDLKSPGNITQSKAEEIESKYQLNTFGSSIKLIEKNTLLSKTLIDELKALNTERRWLIHYLVIKHRKDLYSSKGRIVLLNRIKMFKNNCQRLHKIVGCEIENFAISVGIDPDFIISESQRILSNLKNDEFD